MRYSLFLIISCLFFYSCAEPEARRPISVKTSSTLSTTIAQTKKINNLEEQKILYYIKQDSLHNYITSENGFWYRYDQKEEANSYQPKKNDEVIISYEIRDLNNQIIYDKEFLGNKKYIVDKEDFITALQVGIKMMKEGETITFVIPSYNAYGIVGDGNKIGINQSIISTVTLLKINQNNKNEN
ncbi:MAG: gliding motility-associated peptidyl-prolyl isomerase GldI [Flavobacteriaceae bacterium]